MKNCLDGHEIFKRTHIDHNTHKIDAARSAWHKFLRGYIDELTPEEKAMACHALQCYLTKNKEK